MGRYNTPPTPKDSWHLQPKPRVQPSDFDCDTCWSIEEHAAGVCEGKVDPWTGQPVDPEVADAAAFHDDDFTADPASPRALNYLRDLMVGTGEAADGTRAAALITTMFGNTPDADEVSRYIDTLKRQSAQSSAPAKRVNRYPGNCGNCGGRVEAETGTIDKVDGRWVTYHGTCPAAEDRPAPKPATGLDLTLLPEGRYGVPGSDTRLKVMVRKPSKGKWEGWVFVSDAAAYGQRRNYGRQAPGDTYRGDIVDALEAIAADPLAAMRKYGELTNHCGNCGKLLEDETSVALGIGPVCRGRLGSDFGWQF